jgi:hypothetical protein
MVMTLTYYYSKQVSPLISLTSSSSGDRDNIIRKLLETGASVHTRFRWSEYLQTRIETEKWLHAEFLRLRGCPKVDNPLYCIVGESDYFRNRYGADAMSIHFEISEQHSESISFTIPDSMASYLNWKANSTDYDKRLHGIVFTYHQIREMMDELYLKPIYSDSSGKLFIEAQLWNTDVIPILNGAV